MAEKPYLFGRLGGERGSGHGATGPETGARTMPPYMWALDAASRAAAGSRGWNTLIGDAGGDVPAGTDTSAIWAHTGKAKGPFDVPPARERIPGEMPTNEQYRAIYSDPLFLQFRENLRPREGDTSDDEDDSGGRTNQGVSQELLNLLLDDPKHRWDHLPDDTYDLTANQIDDILQSEFYNAAQVREAAMIPDVLRSSSRYRATVRRQRAPWGKGS